MGSIKGWERQSSSTQEENDCEPETTQFKRKKFRGWSFAGTIIADQIEGIIIDAATGAWYKPDVTEPWVTKIDYDNYLYTIEYKAIPIKKDKAAATGPLPIVEKLRDLKKLLDEGILTQEEYEKEKAKILKH